MPLALLGLGGLTVCVGLSVHLGLLQTTLAGQLTLDAKRLAGSHWMRPVGLLVEGRDNQHRGVVA